MMECFHDALLDSPLLITHPDSHPPLAPGQRQRQPSILFLEVFMVASTDSVGLDLPSIKRQARAGKLSVDQLLDLLERQHRVIAHQQTSLERLVARLEVYEPTVRDEFKFNRVNAHGSSSPPSPTPSFKYGLDADEKRRKKKRRKKSPGRRTTAAKFAEATRFEDVYPDQVPKNDCRLARERAVWRLIDNKAVLVGYRIHVGPDGKEPAIPGVTPRCEYGVEVLVVLAFLIYVIRMSFSKACEVMQFFCELPLQKSQADALLRQLAKHWEGEFESISALIAYAVMVRMDETSWRVGDTNCSLWVFASHLQRLYLFGCHKDDATLDDILPPGAFMGIGVSDDAAVYRDRFEKGQKCWAHLLRKAIKLALLHPRVKRYQRFLDRLLEIYRDGKRAATDKRLGEAGRQARVVLLEEALDRLLLPHLDREATARTSRHERDFINLVNELARLREAKELFTFVLHPELLDATNNSTERDIRGDAIDRDAGRTNKTPAGAKRRSVIASVLESLRASLPAFTLRTVLAEVLRWMREGKSLFDEQWAEIEPRVETQWADAEKAAKEAEKETNSG